MGLAKEASLLLPVLKLILSSRSSATCARLLEQLEDKLLGIFFQWLRNFIEKKPKFRLGFEEEESTKKLLSSYKKEFGFLSDQNVGLTKKRRYLNRRISKDSFFARVFSSLAQTLYAIVNSLTSPPLLEEANASSKEKGVES